MTSATQTDLADMGERFVALVLDGIFLGTVTGLFIRSDSGIGGVLGFVFGLTYQWYFLTRQQGQTPGKMLMHVRVVKTDGSALTDADAVRRYLGYVLNWLALGLGWVWAFFDSNRQGWHDKLAKTYVVKAQRLYKPAADGRPEPTTPTDQVGVLETSKDAS